jgi:hypothetical protein
MYDIGEIVNFNHLMEDRSIKKRCKAGTSVCYWIPAGNIRSTLGNNVHMTMFCKKCGIREDIFLSQQDYETQERLILKEVENVQAG